jgi:hypothetical protein
VHRRAALAVTITTAGILLLTGCSSALDGAKLQDEISSGLATQVGGEWTVTCPESEPLKTGATFTCTATDADGAAQTINVTQTDDQGNVTWELPASDLDLETLKSGVTAELTKQVGGEWTLTCPESVPIENGGTFTCTATEAGGTTQDITVTQTDDQGNVTWETVN